MSNIIFPHNPVESNSKSRNQVNLTLIMAGNGNALVKKIFYTYAFIDQLQSIDQFMGS